MCPRYLSVLLTIAFLLTPLASASAQSTWTPVHNKNTHTSKQLILQADTLSRRELKNMRKPVVVDAGALEDKLCALEEELSHLVAQLGQNNRNKRHHRGNNGGHWKQETHNKLITLQKQLDRIQLGLKKADTVTSYKAEERPFIKPKRIKKLKEPKRNFPKKPRTKALTSTEFTTVHKALRGADNNSRRVLLTSMLKGRTLTTAQADPLVALFYRNDRLGVLKTIYVQISDPAKFHQTYGLLYRDQRSSLAAHINTYEQQRYPKNTRRTQANIQSVTATLRSIYRDKRLAVLESMLHHNSFTSAQARDLAEEFFYRDQQVQALSMLYPKVDDPENFHTVYDMLYRDDRTKLIQWVYNQQG